MPFTGQSIASGIRDVWALRIFGIITALLVFLAFLFCIANGPDNSNNYLLAMNVIITGSIAGIVARWYIIGELAASKLWYILAFGSLLIIQSIVYDIYAFHDTPSAVPSGNSSHTST